MNKNPRKTVQRGNKGKQIVSGGSFKKSSESSKEQINKRIFLGPLDEGADVEYMEVVSGKVSKRKPSFLS